jgi:hypothetical protein
MNVFFASLEYLIDSDQDTRAREHPYPQNPQNCTIPINLKTVPRWRVVFPAPLLALRLFGRTSGCQAIPPSDADFVLSRAVPP